MASGDRRTVLRWAIAAGLAPAFASRAVAASPGPGGPLRPPAGPMTFTRRLERGLHDGNVLVVARSFAVTFGALPAGWLVSGQQVAATVDAPARIAALAALERRRIETGLFPLTLDRSGLIEGGPDPRVAKELDEALAIAQRALGKASLAADERAELDAFVRSVHDAGAKMASVLPGDLFAPRDLTTRTDREMALPGGGEGTIEVSFTAVTDPLTGLMRQAQREIVTTIGADRRLTREDWTLGLA